MIKKIYPAKVLKVLLALCLVLSISSAFLCMNAFADGIIIVGGSDSSSDVIVGDTTNNNNNNTTTGNVVVVGGNNNGNVTITKNPTSETVAKGGNAVFVARADNADGRVWRLVSPDATNTINAKAAPNEFSGLWVDGTNTDTLTLGNVPESLNGWYVECKFEGKGGPVYTSGAKIVVSGAANTTNDPSKTDANNNQASATTQNVQPVLPSISSQPKGATMIAGQVTSLNVTATTTDDSTLNYQWYASSTNSTTSGTPIAGAISAQYQPPEKEGSMYYYVAVWGTKNGQTGTKIFSTPVEVRYNSTGSAANNNNNNYTSTYNGNVINQPSQVVIDAGPSGSNVTNNNGGNAVNTPADRNGTPVSNAQNTASNVSNQTESENGGSTAVVMLVIALVALVACLGLVVKSGLLTKK